MKKKFKLWTKLLCLGVVGIVGLATTSALVVSCSDNKQKSTPITKIYNDPKPIEPLKVTDKQNVNASEFSDDQIKQFVVENQKKLFTELPTTITKENVIIENKNPDDASGSLSANVSVQLNTNNQNRTKISIDIENNIQINVQIKIKIIIEGFKEDTTTTSLSHGKLDGVAHIKPSEAKNKENEGLIKAQLIKKIKNPARTIQPDDISFSISNENNATGSLDVEVTLKNNTYQAKGVPQLEKTLNKVTLTGFKSITPTSYVPGPVLTTNNKTIVADKYSDNDIKQLIFEHKTDIFHSLPESFKKENIILENSFANNKEGKISVNVKTNCYYDDKGIEQIGQKALEPGTNVVIEGFLDGLTTLIATSLVFKEQTTFMPSQWNEHQDHIKNEIINQGIVSNLADGLTLVPNDITLSEPQDINDENGTLKLNVTISGEKAWVNGKKQPVSQVVSLSNLMKVEKPNPEPNPEPVPPTPQPEPVPPSPQPNPEPVPPVPQPEPSPDPESSESQVYATRYKKNPVLTIDNPNIYLKDFDENQAKKFIFNHKEEIFENLPVDFSVDNIFIIKNEQHENHVKLDIKINKYHISQNEVINDSSFLVDGINEYTKIGESDFYLPNWVEINGFKPDGTIKTLDSETIVFNEMLSFEPSNWENHKDFIKNEIIKNEKDLHPNSVELSPNDITLTLYDYNDQQKWLKLDVSVYNPSPVQSPISNTILFYWNTSSNDEFVIDNATGNIVKYLGFSNNNNEAISLEIPQTINNVVVKGISNNVLDNVEYSLKPVFSNITINSLHVPNTLTNIGPYAFNGATFVQDLIIPSTITSFEKSSFGAKFEGAIIANDIQLENMINSGSFIEATFNQDFIIPATMTSICESAFEDATFNGKFVLPNTINTIKNSTFARVIFNSDFEIPNSVTSFCDSAFKEATFNHDFRIPNSIAKIQYNSFTRATFKGKFIVPNSVIELCLEGIYYKEVIIPSSVKTIGLGGTHYQQLIIPSSVEYCKRFITGTFYCDLVLHDSIKTFDSVKIYNATFYQKLKLPSNWYIDFIGNSNVYKKLDFSNVGVDVFDCRNSIFHKEFIPPQSIRLISGYNSEFYEQLVIPNKINTLQGNSFTNSIFHNELIIPNSVNKIAGGGSEYHVEPAFGYATFDKDLKIPDSVSLIGSRAFAQATFHGILSFSDNSSTIIQELAFSGATFDHDLNIPFAITIDDKYSFIDYKGNGKVYWKGELINPNPY